MKLKENSFIIVILGGLLLIIFGKDNSWVEVTGICVVYLAFIAMFFYESVRWYKNNKLIGANFSKINISNVLYELWLMVAVYIYVLELYKHRASRYFYLENKVIEINSFNDFINSYVGEEKLVIYMTIGIGLGAFISTIKKIICRGKVSNDEILLCNGELIKLNEIEKIEVEESLWTFSNKITIESKGKKNVFYIKKKNFKEIEGALSLQGGNSNDTR